MEYNLKNIRKKIADYCVFQERCQSEVQKKIDEFYFLSSEEKGEILIWLIQNRFVNESRFAQAYVKGKFNQKNWGKVKINMALKQKQIPEKLINEALAILSEEVYREKLRYLAEKKWDNITERNILTKKKKLYSYLVQKGYESILVLEIINKFF